jgi:hypothetical protein
MVGVRAAPAGEPREIMRVTVLLALVELLQSGENLVGRPN